MVFYAFAFGMTVGMTTAFSVKPIVYYVIADHLWYPHRRFYRYKMAKDKRLATTPEEYEKYALDAIKSFAMFWIVIAPVIQLAYFSKKPEQKKSSQMLDNMDKLTEKVEGPIGGKNKSESDESQSNE